MLYVKTRRMRILTQPKPLGSYLVPKKEFLKRGSLHAGLGPAEQYLGPSLETHGAQDTAQVLAVSQLTHLSCKGFGKFTASSTITFLLPFTQILLLL